MGAFRSGGLQPEDSGIFQCFAKNEVGETQSHTLLDVTRNQILASGSVQIPRFILLESGGLQITPAFLQDAGNYTCCAVNSEGALFASATLTVWNRTFIVRSPEDSTVIKGTTATLQCEAAHDPRISIRYVWKKDNVVINPSSSSRVAIEKDGALVISQTWSGDIGDYTCEVTSFGGNDSRVARMEVIELPHPPQNLLASLNSSVSRSVILSWVRPFDGNSPVLHYIVELSENNSPWKVHLSDIDPKMTNITVSGLTPARTYQFRVCAVNQVGKGQYSRETSRLLLPEEPPSAPPKNIVASGRTNQSIMVQWQPPPESEHNGVLHGYILRYRLAGLPGEYQYKNITSAEINYCLVKDLIIWTQYEIQVASYNGAGLGAFSRAVTEYTLQGVPTAPPQNVQAEAVNSTTIQFFWNPPPQQFINGINQGYKLLAWPVDAPEAVTTVTITPDFHGVHSGAITSLKKFTAYYTSVLCFTTPGDGPQSPPQLLKTHEDKPGAVGHLSFMEILDTSLKVRIASHSHHFHEQPPLLSGPGPNHQKSCNQANFFFPPNWSPRDSHRKGYQLSWEVYSRNESRLARTLANTTLEYKITGLSSLTTYTIEVAAMTAKGTGSVTSSTISSGIPPAENSLAISLGSDEASLPCLLREGHVPCGLCFPPPGHDYRARGSHLLATQEILSVSGLQVGVVGEEEEWVTLCEVEKESDAQMLEIPNLTPYTHYRFRMRQVNVVGQSPLSQPSRVIQTLQAPPDVAPGSVTVRTASETSLWVRWVPLPDTQYNGNPESVGYRIKYWCVDAQSPVLTKVIGDRLEREHTLEDLEEWTEYELQIQAFNAIGAGPWSEVVRGRTRESVPSAPPENVSAEAVSSTQILLTWAAVPEAEQNGLILGYKILFRAKDVENKLSSQVVRGNHTLSVLLAGLRKYLLYEIQVLAFTRIGDGVPSSPPVIERTKDDALGLPLDAASSTSPRVCCSEHLGGRSHCDVARHSSVPVRQTVLSSSLRGPCRQMALFVLPSLRSPEISQLDSSLINLIKSIIAPGPPVRLVFPEVRLSSVRIVWQPPEEPNGIILGYQIAYRLATSSPNKFTTVEVGSTVRQFMATDLLPESPYIFRASAKTRQGWGQPLEATVITTEKRGRARLTRGHVLRHRLLQVRTPDSSTQASPDPLQALASSGSLTPSSSRNWCAFPVKCEWRTILWAPASHWWSIPGDTEPESKCLQNVRRLEDGGDGKDAPNTIRALCKAAGESGARISGERPAPPRQLRVPQAEVTSRSLRLHWLPGSDGSSPIRYFTVQTKELPGGDWRTFSSSVSHDATSCAIDRLNPFTSYKLRLKATNDIGDSDFGAETDAVTTLQDVPAEPPNSVSVTPHTTSSVLVQWQPPKVESLNGLLLGYRIYYRELEYESAGAGPESKAVKNPSAMRAELAQLKKYKRYEVLMTAYNIVGESPASAPVEVFVGEAVFDAQICSLERRAAVLSGAGETSQLTNCIDSDSAVGCPLNPHPPAMPPQNLQLSAISASQLEVAWEPPPADSQNGNIQGYKASPPGPVYYWEVDSQNDTEKVKVLFLPETSVRLKNLTSYTKYLVCISAFNAAGDGPKSSPGQGRTHQAAPSAPSFLTFSEITCSTLNVSWGEPAAANGVLQGYRVIYEPLAAVQGVSKVVTVEIKGNWQRWLKVRDLTKAITYLFRVQARTTAYGPELQANVTAGPAEGSPGSPQHVLVSKTASGLTLYWTAGLSGARPTTGYVIETRPSDEGLWDLFAKDVPLSATSYAVGLDRLKPGVSYEFRVVAVNEFGYGEPSAPSVAVSAHTDSPFYEEWWFLLVMALCSLILILLVVFALILHGQTKKYRSCNPGKSVSHAEESVTLDNGGFTALELNSRHLNVKSTFSKKNGTRSPPRPSPGGLHYSDEDLCNKYNGAVLTESVALTEKPLDASESDATDSDYEDELPKHSFVNHYMSDPTYYNSWKRQQKGTKPPAPYRYEECGASETEPYFQTVITTQSSGGVYTPTGQAAPGARTPVTGFSSFV
ncbi:hypothetical protein lerEdw1_018503 [Lerista edwardsae]|nr:hypothetical protein lerEdw1_018503 [Lerista edwardsae]